jgi:hypothetical protein
MFLIVMVMKLERNLMDLPNRETEIQNYLNQLLFLSTKRKDAEWKELLKSTKCLATSISHITLTGTLWSNYTAKENALTLLIKLTTFHLVTRKLLTKCRVASQKI